VGAETTTVRSRWVAAAADTGRALGANGRSVRYVRACDHHPRQPTNRAARDSATPFPIAAPAHDQTYTAVPRVPPCTHARPRVCTISVRTGHVLDDDRASEATDLQSDIVLYVLLPCMHLASHMGSTCPLACVACISQCPASHDHLTPPPVYLTSARTKDLRTYHPTLPTTHARLMKMCTGVVSCTFNCFFVCAI
jgi:hypothetical protein